MMPKGVHRKLEGDPPPPTVFANTNPNGATSLKKQESRLLQNGNSHARPESRNEKKRFLDRDPKTSGKSNVFRESEVDSPDRERTKKVKIGNYGYGEPDARTVRPVCANGSGLGKAEHGGDRPKAEQTIQKPKQKGVDQTQKNGVQDQQLVRTAKALEVTRATLPIWSQKANIRWSLRLHNVLLLHGETGSGKSTQVPQFLYTEPWCKAKRISLNKDGRKQDVVVGGVIAITQPRRIAAITLAQRVARELGSPLRQGQDKRVEGKVGFSVRFDTLVPRGTRIKFVTEGTLLQEMLHDPYLTKYSAVIVDEVHERSVDVDLICGFLRQIVHGDKKGRGGIPLKVVLMSATMDLGGIEAFFAKPGWDPEYVPGQNYGKVLAPHIPENERLLNELRGQEKTQVARDKESKTIAEREKSGLANSIQKDGVDRPFKIPQITGKDGERTRLKKDIEERSSRRSSIDTTYSSWDGFSDDDNDTTEDQIIERVPAGVTDSEIEPNGVGTEYVRGRQYSVDIKYEKEQPIDVLERVGQAILRIHHHEAFPGDILAFVTGQDDIETLQRLLAKEAVNSQNKNVPRMKVLPLYGSLSAEGQQAAFEPVREKFTRKIVVATNIAETSVTVSGVRYVVDSGMVKMKQYRTSLGMDSLLPTRISKNSAEQRLGRAAREAKGYCWRIYTKEQYENFPEDDVPEILRSSAIEAVLKMKARGVKDPFTFPLMDTPDTDKIMKALSQLVAMGALDEHQNLTEIGMKMATMPLPAQYGRVVIAATDCLLEVIDIISLLTTDAEVFLNPKSEDDNEAFESSRADITRREGDLITLLTTMQRYNAENSDRTAWCTKRHINARAMRMAANIRKQLHTFCLSQSLLSARPSNEPQPFVPTSPEKAETILKTFLGAFVTRTATLHPNGSFVTLQPKNPIAIHPSSVLYGRKVEAIMFLEHVYTKKNYAKKVSAIQANWILEAMHFERFKST